LEPTKKNAKGLKIISIITAAIIFSFLMTAGLSGCKSAEPEADRDTISETDQGEAVDESGEEAPPEETEATDIITDNINMLSGLELTASVQNHRPLAIMVQNSPQARPHSGLIYADMVFEAVAEAGVTRFVTLFSSNDADIIGPVRSARIYFAEIARSFDPVYTFWGTYPEGYTAIKAMDMDVLDANSDAYVPHTTAGWRDHSRSDFLEHTAFIDTYGIKKDAEKFGYSLEGGQSPMAFKVDAEDPMRGDITEITVDFSTTSYRADFSYEVDANKYLRSLAGEPHTDYETGQQISLNNVVVLITDIDGPLDSSGHMMIRTTGTHSNGRAFYFMDGSVIEGTWGRDSIFDPFEFNDQNGEQILFNRGSTWVCVIGNTEQLTY
jgi:hypothetical protein